MTRFYIKKGEELIEYELQEINGRILVRSADREYDIDFRQLRDVFYSAIINNQSWFFEARPGTSGIEITLNNQSRQIEVLSEREKIQWELMKKDARLHHQMDVRAPMPGLILKIEVQAGEEIKIGQPLLIMEAMKMENEIRCQTEGVVKEILVQENQKVEKDTVLIKIK